MKSARGGRAVRKRGNHPAATAETWSPWGTGLRLAAAEFRARFDRAPVILNWSGAPVRTGDGIPAAFSPVHPDLATLPYPDWSIDLTVVPVDDPARLAEAARVTLGAVGLVDWDGWEIEPPLCWRWRDEAPALPETTILIPTYNTSAMLTRCLTSLTHTLPMGVRGEILIADDASTDDTPAVVAAFARHDPRIRYLRRERNGGFLTNCNEAAASATGKFLIFLNVDTIPLPGWLPPLLQTFARFSRVGAVGGKLLFDDGALQEAGGIVFRDGSAANTGRRALAPDDPLVSHTRPVDYCSGALLATPRRLFQEIGGFDERYRPAYFEDTDYCLAVRARGWQVLYQPASEVVHLDGGAHTREQHRTLMNRNQDRFAAKWAEQLVEHPPRPRVFDASTWESLILRADRPETACPV